MVTDAPRQLLMSLEHIYMNWGDNVATSAAGRRRKITQTVCWCPRCASQLIGCTLLMRTATVQPGNCEEATHKQAVDFAVSNHMQARSDQSIIAIDKANKPGIYM